MPVITVIEFKLKSITSHQPPNFTGWILVCSVLAPLSKKLQKGLLLNLAQKLKILTFGNSKSKVDTNKSFCDFVGSVVKKL